jgi:hypothetical protein
VVWTGVGGRDVVVVVVVWTGVGGRDVVVVVVVWVCGLTCVAVASSELFTS